MDTSVLVDTIQSTRVVSRITAGCITLLIYDTILTFPQEVETIWKGRWTITKVLYILTRYSAFAESAVLIYQLSIPGEWYKSCSLAFKANILLFLFGLACGEVIMTIRTWAVWGKHRTLMYLFPMFYTAMMAGSLVATVLFLQDVQFDPNPLTPYLGCLATHTTSILFVSWIILMVYDFVMFVLMAIPAFKACSSSSTLQRLLSISTMLFTSGTDRFGGGSHLMLVVLRDGVLYYAYLFLLSLANIVVTLTLTSSLILVLSLLSRMLHAILACRVVLDIHQLGRQGVYSDDGTHALQISSNFRSTTRPPEVYSHVTVSYYPSSTPILVTTA